MLSGALDHQGVIFNKLQNNITSGISNRTGKQSVRFPYKIKSGKEGFTDKILNEKYTDVTDEYTQLQTELQDNNLDILKRLNLKTNATLGKNIALNDSGNSDDTSLVKGYVTDLGIFKAYNPSTWLNAVGAFGCPSAQKIMKVPVNQSDQLNSSTPGYTFTTENFPKLLVGQPMQSGAACGGAGKNVYVDRLVDKPTASYVGCYKNVSEMTNMGAMDYSNCMSSAMSSDYAYFGLTTDVDRQINCMVSNALASGQEQLTAFTPVLVWESATKNESDSINCCTVSAEGFLTVSDSADASKILFQSNDPVASCVNGGEINNLVATFGGNCADKYNVATGNATQAVMSSFDTAGSNSSFSFLVNDKNIGLASNDCENKAWDASFQCGNVSKVGHMKNATGKNATFNCDAQVATCTFVFTLHNNGNACLFQTKNRKHINKVWCMSKKSNNMSLPKNSEFAATKGKTGANHFNNGHTLFAGEWIGSNNGSLRLVMQTDGNLCLYSYVAVETCARKNDYMTGVADVNAVYKIDNAGNRSVLGKMGYIDQDDVLHNYAADALAYSDKYTLLPNTDLGTAEGNNLGDPVSNSTVNACKTACSANNACSGYAFESGANVCYLKKGNADSTFDNHVTKQGTTSAIRLPRVLDGKSCATDTVNISSEKYDRYVKGEELSDANMGSICNPFSSNPVSETTKVQYAAINKDLASLGSGIMGGINRFGENIGQSQRNFAKTDKKMMKSVQSYKKTHDFSKGMLKEGMLNMQDLARMESDSELLVTHQNMRYIYWMLAALGLITVCMAVANKKR